jgi:hypothetical protein
MACVSTLLILLSVDRDRRALARRSRAADLTVILANTDLGKQCDDFGVDGDALTPDFGMLSRLVPRFFAPLRYEARSKAKGCI